MRIRGRRMEVSCACWRAGQEVFAKLRKDVAASYDSVKRFMRRQGMATPIPFRHTECAPDEEAQVDFSTGGPIVAAHQAADDAGKRHKTNVFRIVL
jgi:hypothetical protein